MTHRRSSILPLLLLALGGCGGSECDCIAPVPEVTAVIITGVPLVPIRVGNRVRLTADVKSTGFLADTRVTWRTSAATIVEVEQDGLVTAVGVGTATVEAIAGADTTKRGSTVIRVEAPAGAIALQSPARKGPPANRKLSGVPARASSPATR